MRELLSARDNQSQVQALQHGCADNATLTGEFPEGIPEGKWPLCDKTIGDDAVAKLSIAAANLKQTGMPFFLAVGFRKPHTPWRFPAPYLSKCVPPGNKSLYRRINSGSGIYLFMWL